MAKKEIESTVNTLEKYTKSSVSTLKKITGDVAKLKSDCSALVIVDINDKAGYEAVDKARKNVKSIRTGVERKRKELNEPALSFQRDLMAAAKQLTELLTPIESDLEAKIKKIDDEKEAIRLAEIQKISNRTNQLYKRGMTFNGEYFAYKGMIMYPDKIGLFTTEEWDNWISVLDKQIEADKEPEPIFPVFTPEPEKIVQQSAPNEEIEMPRGSDFQASDFRKPVDEIKPAPDFTPTITEYKGLWCDVYRNTGMDCTARGSSSKHDQLLLVGEGIPQIFTETNPAKVVKLEFMNVGVKGAITIEGTAVRIKSPHPYVKPLSIDSGTHSMFGGNFLYTSDSRFPSDQPIAIHDRVETGVYDGR